MIQMFVCKFKPAKWIEQSGFLLPKEWNQDCIRQCRWELDAKVAERGPTDEVPPTDSRGVSVDGANPLQGRWPPTEAGRDGTEPNESGTERSKNGTERNESGMERSENGTGQNGIGAETPSLGPRELPNELIPGREKALKGLELDEERRRERLRVLEEREAVLRGQLEELEGALEERRAADVAGGPKRISDNGSKGGGGLPVGAADRFDQANFDR